MVGFAIGNEVDAKEGTQLGDSDDADVRPLPLSIGDLDGYNVSPT